MFLSLAFFWSANSFFAALCSVMLQLTEAEAPWFCSYFVNAENSFWTGLHFNDAGREHRWSRVWDSSCTIERLRMSEELHS